MLKGLKNHRTLPNRQGLQIEFGYPKLSDISFSSRRFRPENQKDPLYFQHTSPFFSTRLIGSMTMEIRKYHQAHKCSDLNYNGAISSILPDEIGGFVRLRGRDRSVNGDLSVLAHLPSKPQSGMFGVSNTWYIESCTGDD